MFTIFPGFLLQPAVNVSSFYPFLLKVHGNFHVPFNTFCEGYTEIFMYLSHFFTKGTWNFHAPFTSFDKGTLKFPCIFHHLLLKVRGNFHVPFIIFWLKVHGNFHVPFTIFCYRYTEISMYTSNIFRLGYTKISLYLSPSVVNDKLCYWKNIDCRFLYVFCHSCENLANISSLIVFFADENLS